MQPHEVVDSFRKANRRGAGGERKAPCKHQCAPTWSIRTPSLELDAPTTARTEGLPPWGGTYFLSKRKKVPKKASGTATTGKRPFTAHFDGGARNVARNGVGQRSPTSGARSCSPFSAVKMGGPFSLRCLSPLCSAADWHWADSNGAAWDVSMRIAWLRSTEKRA